MAFDSFNYQDDLPEPPKRRKPVTIKMHLVSQRHYTAAGDCECGGIYWKEDFKNEPAACDKCGKTKKPFMSFLPTDDHDIENCGMFSFFFLALFLSGLLAIGLNA